MEVGQGAPFLNSPILQELVVSQIEPGQVHKWQPDDSDYDVALQIYL